MAFFTSALVTTLLTSPPIEPPHTPSGPDPLDSDRDGVSDVKERARGTDPHVPGLFPGAYPHIPEPMVFDLVRGLGARRGEFEVNTLGVVGFMPYRGVEWAPEIEWAFADRHALEFELPMHDAHVVAIKFAVQGTLREIRPKFIHGWQIIAQYVLDESAVDLAALYLAGRRVGRRVSLFAMMGAGSTATASAFHVAFLLNPSIFIDVSEAVTLGIENNSRIEGAASMFRSIPQMHWQIGRHVRLQLGGGVEATEAGVSPVAATRLIIE